VLNEVIPELVPKNAGNLLCMQYRCPAIYVSIAKRVKGLLSIMVDVPTNALIMSSNMKLVVPPVETVKT
jgi:hypothetical protein